MNLREIGSFGKPHGIAGEINAVVDEGIDLRSLRCIFVDVDGIDVPFFIASMRPRGADALLLKIDGIDSDARAKQLLANKPFSALADELPDEIADPDGLYAADLIGYTAVEPDGNVLGEITEIDDNTANVLFIISRPSGQTLYAPVAQEFIADINTDGHTITLNLPEGIKDL